MTGKVVKWDGKKGFGFIEAAGFDRGVFVHHTEIVSDRRRKDLYEGDTVEFDVTKTDKGPKALKVRVVKA